jgi:hypothetical protein
MAQKTKKKISKSHLKKKVNIKKGVRTVVKQERLQVRKFGRILYWMTATEFGVPVALYVKKKTKKKSN